MPKTYRVGHLNPQKVFNLKIRLFLQNALPELNEIYGAALR
jgi:hypothetical protein